MICAGLMVATPQRGGTSLLNSNQSDEPAFEIGLPVFVSGREIGHVDAEIRDNGTANINRQAFAALLGTRLSDALRQAVLTQTSKMISAEELTTLGVKTRFDSAALRLDVDIPLDLQGANTVRVVDDTRGTLGSDYVQPSAFSGSLTLTASQSIAWNADGRERVGPLDILGQFAANLFGYRGVYLFSEFVAQQDDGTRLERGNTFILHDDPVRALRLAAGDVVVPVIGFQASPVIGGVSVARSYTELQPFRNVRPNGLFRFQLDRSAVVDIRVNGTSIRQLRLDPGQYDLRDFPFLTGANEVEIYSLDGFNQQLLTRFTQFFSAGLLHPSVDEFAFSAGFPQSRSRDGSIVYRSENPTFSGYYRRGLSQTITLGINAQLDRHTQVGGIEGAWASPIGNWFGSIALSDDDEAGDGQQMILGYEFSVPELGPLENFRANAEYRTTSAGFRFIGRPPLTADNPYRSEVRAGLSTAVPGNLFVGLSGSYLERRDRFSDEYRWGANVGTSLSRISLNASYEEGRSAFTGKDRRFLITALRSLGRRSSARASFDSRGNTAQLQYSRSDAPEVGDYGIEASLERNDRQILGSGLVRYNANRFQASLRHEAVRPFGRERDIIQFSDFTLATQIAFSGDRFAFGRPVGPSFAIAAAHPSLEGRKVGLAQGFGRERPQATSGMFGPALAPVGEKYSPQLLSVDVQDLPLGYDIGKFRYDLFPGAASGYSITVGSDASRMLVGNVIDNAGQPIALLGGRLKSLDRATEAEKLIFTGRGGRFSIEGIQPGRYRMSLGPNGRYRVEFEIDAKTQGLVDLGQLKAEGTER